MFKFAGPGKGFSSRLAAVTGLEPVQARGGVLGVQEGVGGGLLCGYLGLLGQLAGGTWPPLGRPPARWPRWSSGVGRPPPRPALPGTPRWPAPRRRHTAGGRKDICDTPTGCLGT